MGGRARLIGVAAREVSRLDHLAAESASQLHDSYAFEIRRLRAIEEQTQRAMAAVVAAAREDGETWEDLAVMTGLTVSAVWKRYGASSPRVDMRRRADRRRREVAAAGVAAG